MDLDKVTYLLALADTRNYSRAAEQCHISQPALTRYIKNLEEELNVTLFDRSSFPIRLTYAGERYVDGLLKILEMKEKLDKIEFILEHLREPERILEEEFWT